MSEHELSEHELVVTSTSGEEIARLTFSEDKWNALVQAALQRFLHEAIRARLDEYEREHDLTDK
jgi:hypothetical protein